MKKIKFILLSVSLTILLNSCIYYPESRHYVSYYITSFDSIFNSDVKEYPNVILIGVDTRKPYDYISEKRNNVLFEEVSRKNKDFEYNKVKVARDIEIVLSRLRFFLIDKVIDVDVTSDVAWDAAHPVGSSLKDLFLFLSGSPDSYIRSGYRDIDKKALEEFNRKNHILVRFNKVYLNDFRNTLLPFGGKLSEIEFNNYNLIKAGHHHLFLLFPAVPIPSPETKVTISMTLSNGKTYTATKILKQQ